MDTFIKLQLEVHLNKVLHDANQDISKGITVDALLLVLMETRAFVSTAMSSFINMFPNMAEHQESLTKIYAFEYMKIKSGIDINLMLSTKTHQSLPTSSELVDIIIKSFSIQEDTPEVPTPEPMSPITISSAPKSKTGQSSKLRGLLKLKKSKDESAIPSDKLNLD